MSTTLISSVLEKIDRYLKTDEAKDNGFTSRPDVIYEALRVFFKNTELNKSQPQKIETKSKIVFVGTIGNKIILEDSECGTITVVIDEDKKLQCFYDDVDPHDNKWVRYCLKNKESWEFLQDSGVKLVKPRTIDKDLVQ